VEHVWSVLVCSLRKSCQFPSMCLSFKRFHGLVPCWIKESKYEEGKFPHPSSIILALLLVRSARSPVLPWCVSIHYALGIMYPINVCNIRTQTTDIDCRMQHCRRLPINTIAMCKVVVVRGNSKMKDLTGGRRCMRSFLGSKKGLH